MQANGGCLVFCTTKAACENGAKMFVQLAAEPSDELLTKRWSVTLDLLAAQASQIHEPLGDILKCGFTVLSHLLGAGCKVIGVAVIAAYLRAPSSLCFHEVNMLGVPRECVYAIFLLP